MRVNNIYKRINSSVRIFIKFVLKESREIDPFNTRAFVCGKFISSMKMCENFFSPLFCG